MADSMHYFRSDSRRAAIARLIAVVALCGGVVLDAVAGNGKLQPSCADGVCEATVEKNAAYAPCEDAVILLAWRQAGGATLIQCMTDDADMDKPSFVYDRDKPAAPAYPLTGMRYFVSAYLGELASGKVGDKFSSHALCKPPTPPRMAPGDILIGEKVPTQDNNNPYCYRVLRVASTRSGVVMRADDGDSPHVEAKHADWDGLAAKMTSLIASAGSPVPADVPDTASSGGPLLHVVHAKAPLRDSPDSGVAQHGYLVQGDAVSVLDRTKAANGWLKVHYVGKSGKAIDRWVRADDLESVAH